ncbi:ParM/StbA family protein [Bacillus cereus]|uniref:ParM/StbA family protein n=1 Tax=Bacillus cereus TaxID=1396 RepID=UPI00187986BA|nr:ParM/StbA family protein [Bacillus cereus]MBE7123675.1 ParM/StbA family protein [Bacillus cereus]
MTTKAKKNEQPKFEHITLKNEIPHVTYNVKNDNGNSTQKLILNNKYYSQQNIYVKDKPKKETDREPMSFVPNLLDNLHVNIISSQVKTTGDLYVGKKALSSNKIPNNMSINLGRKHKEDLPVINTLALIAGVALQESIELTNDIPESVKVTCNMATALPLLEWDNTTSDIFSKRFINDEQPHKVNVYLGNLNVTVEITFKNTIVIPEGIAALYSLVQDENSYYREGEIFKEFIEEYGLQEFTGEDIINMRRKKLDLDIGDGTIEFPVTQGYLPDTTLSSGKPWGIGKIVDLALPEFIEQYGFEDLSRQEFMTMVTDTSDSYHIEAKAKFYEYTEDHVDLIVRYVRDLINKSRKAFELIVVYGGGSILLKDALYPALKELAEESKAKVLYIPEEYAVNMNVDGLSILLEQALKQSNQ